jgi:hypothetical protein
VNLKGYWSLLVLLLALAASANATAIRGNSSYGTGNPANYSCLDIQPNGSLALPSMTSPTLNSATQIVCTTDVTEQDFSASIGDYVYDYMINDLTNFTLTITSTNPSVEFDDYGEFACAPPSGIECTSGLTVNTNVVTPESSVTFTVTGNNTSNPFVFFVSECTSNSSSSFCSALSPADLGPVSVTATVKAAAPEPHFLPLVGLGLLAAILIRRRQLANS